MSWWNKLATMLGVREDQVDDALRSESHAKQAVQLSRRGFFGAGACMVAGSLVPTKTYGFLFEAAAEPLALWATPWAGVMTSGVLVYALLPTAAEMAGILPGAR